MLRRTHIDWQVAVVSAAIQEEASARRVLRLLLDRWVEERLQYKAKPALRALVLAHRGARYSETRN